MANLIDNTFFFGEINIAQLNVQAVQDNINDFIAKYEPKYINEVLGYAFAKLYNAGITANEQRFLDIRDGKEFTNCEGYTDKWNGFTNSDKLSPIANYIYYWYIRTNTTYSSGIGEVQPTTENGTIVTPYGKLYHAWNEMVEAEKILYDFLQNIKDDDGNLIYPEFDICQVKNKHEKMNYFDI